MGTHRSTLDITCNAITLHLQKSMQLYRLVSMRPMLAVHLAVMTAALICVFVAGPVGWLWFGILAAFLTAGVGLPVLTVHTLNAECGTSAVKIVEGETATFVLTTSNRCPWSAWRVDFVVQDVASRLGAVPSGKAECALAVPGLGRGTYGFEDAAFECDFPLGIFRALAGATPRSIDGATEAGGDRASDAASHGLAERPERQGRGRG